MNAACGDRMAQLKVDKATASGVVREPWVGGLMVLMGFGLT